MAGFLVVVMIAGLLAQVVLLTSSGWRGFTIVACAMAGLSLIGFVTMFSATSSFEARVLADEQSRQAMSTMVLLLGFLFVAELAAAAWGATKFVALENTERALIANRRRGNGNRLPLKRIEDDPQAIASSPSTSEQVLRRMWVTSPTLRKTIAENPACPRDLLTEGAG